MKTPLILYIALFLLISCDTPKEKRDQAEVFYKDGKFEKAIIAISTAIEQEPDSIINYAFRIHIYEATGKFKEEKADINKIIELKGNSKSLNAHLLRSSVSFKLGQFDQALSDVDYFLEYSEYPPVRDLADAYMTKATTLYLLDSLKSAQKFYELAIKESHGKLNTIESQGLVGLANLSKTPKDALNILNKAIGIDEKNSIAYGARATLYMNDFDNNNDAFTDLKTAIKLDPYSATLYFNLGQLFYRVDRLDSAIYYYEKAIETSPQSYENGEIHMNLAISYQDIGNIDKVISEFKKAEFIIPDNDLLLYNYSWSLSDQGKHKDALVKISKAIEINSSDEDYFNLKGSILRNLALFDEAEAAFKKAISMNPKHGTAYYNLGSLFSMLNDHKQSILFYDKAVNLNYDLQYTLVNRASEKVEINKTSGACADLKRAFKLGRSDIKPLIEELCN